MPQLYYYWHLWWLQVAEQIEVTIWLSAEVTTWLSAVIGSDICAVYGKQNLWDVWRGRYCYRLELKPFHTVV